MKKNISYNNLVCRMCWILSLIAILLCKGNDSEYISKYILCVKFEAHFFVLVIIFIALAIEIVLFSSKIKFDKISLCLFIRIIVCLIPLLYVSYDRTYWGNYIPVVISFLSYFIFCNYSGDLKKIYNIYIFFALIICFEVIISWITAPVDYQNVLYKYYMQIPLGASNRIACYIVPAVFLEFAMERKKKYKFLVYLILLTGIILTKSRTCVFTLVLVFAFYRKRFSFKKSTYVSILLSSMVLICVIYIYREWFINVFQKFILGFSNTVYTQSYSKVDAFTSGRISVIRSQFKVFLKNICFGNGFGFNSSVLKSHNFIIDLFAQTGITGFIIFIIPICLYFKYIHKYRKCCDIRASMLFVLSILIISLGEVNLFTVGTDYIFWSIIAISKNNAYIKSNIKAKE